MDKFRFLKFGRCIAHVDWISSITIDEGEHENTYDIIFAFKDRHTERALTCESEKEAEDCLDSLFDILFTFN